MINIFEGSNRTWRLRNAKLVELGALETLLWIVRLTTATTCIPQTKVQTKVKIQGERNPLFKTPLKWPVAKIYSIPRMSMLHSSRSYTYLDAVDELPGFMPEGCKKLGGSHHALAVTIAIQSWGSNLLTGTVVKHSIARCTYWRRPLVNPLR